jgi:hypothetical protein
VPGLALLARSGPAGAARRFGARVLGKIVDHLLRGTLLGELVRLAPSAAAQDLVEESHGGRIPGRVVAKRWAQYIVSSDPDEHAQRLREVEILGATVVCVQNGSGTEPERALAVYGESFLPALRGAPV